MSVEDKRKTKKYIFPYLSWISKDTINYLFDITDKDDVKVGEIEVGTDGFIQIRLEVDKKLLCFNWNKDKRSVV
jgi:hypothetical protein